MNPADWPTYEQWRAMTGAQAFAWIDKHAESSDSAGMMMQAWADARKSAVTGDRLDICAALDAAHRGATMNEATQPAGAGRR